MRSKNVVFFRIDYMEHRRFIGASELYADQIRLLFTRAGYLEKVSNGTYTRVKHIPTSLSLNVLQKEAYPNAKWRNK